MLPMRCALVVLLVPLATGCAKKREEASPAPASTAPFGVDPATRCRPESVMAASSLVIGGVQALDLPAEKVKASLACSGGPLQECAGLLGTKTEGFVGTLAYTLAVDPKGFVTEAKLDGAAPAAVAECASQILTRLDFPGAEKGVTTVKVSLQYEKHRESPRFAGAEVSAATEVLTGKLENPNKALDAAMGRIRGCYLLALEREAEAAGTIAFSLHLSATGTVSDATLEQRGTLTKDAVSCVDTVFRATTFPASGEAKLKGTLTMRKRAP